MSARSRSQPWFRVPGERWDRAVELAYLEISHPPSGDERYSARTSSGCCYDTAHTGYAFAARVLRVLHSTAPVFGGSWSHRLLAHTLACIRVVHDPCAVYVFNRDVR